MTTTETAAALTAARAEFEKLRDENYAAASTDSRVSAAWDGLLAAEAAHAAACAAA